MANGIGVIRYIHFILIVGALKISIGLLLAVVEDSWWTIQLSKPEGYYEHFEVYHFYVKNNIGLWKACEYGVERSEHCKTYENILRFKDERLVVGYGAHMIINHQDLDIILVLLIIAIISSILSLFILIKMLRTLHKIPLWKKYYVLVMLLYAVTFGVGMAACTYGEISFQKHFIVDGFEQNVYVHGWCFVTSFCASVACLFIVIVLTVIRCKMKESENK